MVFSLIEKMSQTYFQNDYWAEAQNLTNVKLDKIKLVSDVMKLPISEYREHIKEICDKAKAEEHISQQLATIKDFWKHEELDIVNGNWISPCLFGPGVQMSLAKIDE